MIQIKSPARRGLTLSNTLLGAAGALLLVGTMLPAAADDGGREARSRSSQARSSSAGSSGSSSGRTAVRRSSSARSPQRSAPSTARRAPAARSNGSSRSASSQRGRTGAIQRRPTGRSYDRHPSRHGYNHYYGGYGNYGRYGGYGYGSYYYPSRYYSPYRHGLYYSLGWSGYYPWWLYPAVIGASSYGGSYNGDSLEEAGGLDLDVSPEKAQVYINGELVGIADNYDGFPQYLWLPKGTYDVVFYHPGYRSISRQYSIYAGDIIDVEDRMEPGEAKLPEELISKSTVNRDERLRDESEKRREAGQAYSRSWRDRVRDERRAAPQRAPSVSANRPRPRPDILPEAIDLRDNPSLLLLTVEPKNASLYLDGRFLGVYQELFADSGKVILDPGSHRLDIVHPDFEKKSLEFEVEAGQELKFEVELEDD